MVPSRRYSDVSVLLGGAASITGPTSFPHGTGTAAVAVGEFNKDGDSDLAVAEESGRFLVLLGGSGGGQLGQHHRRSGVSARIIGPDA
jgi:hypothetical protein